MSITSTTDSVIDALHSTHLSAMATITEPVTKPLQTVFDDYDNSDIEKVKIFRPIFLSQDPYFNFFFI